MASFNTIFRTYRLAVFQSSICRSIHFSARRNALTTFKLSDIGEGISEVELIKWEKKVGDEVEEMEPVCTVQSDKAAVDITSRYTGIVKKLYVEEGSIIKIGCPLMDIDTVNDDNDTSNGSASSQTSNGTLNTGVNRYYSTNSKIVNDSTLHSKSAASNNICNDNEPIKIPLSIIGIGMVKSMVASLQVPHVTVGDDLNLTKLQQLYHEFKAISTAKITITPILIKALSLALEKYPIMNSKFGDNCFMQYPRHNISIAMATKRGLIVPCIKNVNDLSIREIQGELLRLQEAANANKLSLDDIRGGTCTLSNLGAIGGTFVAARLFDGQACIVALGAAKTVPIYNDVMELVPASIAPIGITADHRHIDGATMAMFASAYKEIVQNVEKLRENF